MSTTQSEISTWFDEGVAEGATHMIVVCDTFDWEDYPVFVKEDENVRAIEKQYSGPNMQKVMEVYNLKMDKLTQLNKVRSFTY